MYSNRVCTLTSVVLVMVAVVMVTIGGQAENVTYSSYDYSSLLAKHPRQYSNSYSGYAPSSSIASSPIEAIAIGCLAVFGLSLFGIPLLFLLANMFSNNLSSGVNLIPTATTNVNSGRRRRRSPQANQFDGLLFSKLIDSFNTFINSEEKMKLLQRIIS